MLIFSYRHSCLFFMHSRWYDKMGRLIFAVVRFWNTVPAIIAPIFALLAVFILWDPGFYFRHFGPDPDPSVILHAQGYMLDRMTTKSPYVLRTNSARVVTLYCDRGRASNYCLDHIPLHDKSIDILFAPFPSNIWKIYGGVIIGVKVNNHIYISKEEGKKRLLSDEHPRFGLRIFKFMSFIISIGIVFPALLFIAIGNVLAVRRVLSPKKDLK